MRVRARCGISRRTLINNLIEEPVSVLQPRERGAGSLIKTDLAHTRVHEGTHTDSRARKIGESRCPLSG